ncbi:MAG: hypothetical protein CL458_03055 [Acidimicrobiaceae bacterium]|nr:hypothetical protein [Acidimicrobiaceae bacterium]|tara:strand:- start:5338 stop:5748 length:411 start_codon:yes stop_codon:yes gene_type:complete
MLGLAVAGSLIVGFVVAAAVIGRETRRLSRLPRQPVWRLEEAAAFVEGEISFEIAAKTDPETLRELLKIHLNELQFNSDPDSEQGVADSASAVQNLYREARSNNIEITRPTVAAMMEAHLQYLKLIGALGPTQRPS